MKGKKLIKAGIFGATGYGGEELLRLLYNHKEVEIVSLTSKSFAGKKYSDVYGNFSTLCNLVCEEQNIVKLSNKCDVLFLALPHGIASAEISKEIISKTKVIDLGADFRLKDKSVYEMWYKTTHNARNLLSCAVYGLPEWNREKIKKANLIANPGCYATCSILTTAPLLKEGIIEPYDIIIDAKSGVSGAGRTLDMGTHYCECSESVKAYKVASHRHTPEIEQVLEDISNLQTKILFTPHLIPMNRGILVSAYFNPKKDIAIEDIREIYKKYYKDEYFVRVLENNAPPETRWVKGSNFCDINIFKDERTGRIIAFGAIDNLVKGAAGQAIQNMNIMFGIKETMGLETVGMFP